MALPCGKEKIVKIAHDNEIDEKGVNFIKEHTSSFTEI